MAFHWEDWVMDIFFFGMMRIVARVIIFERVERSQKAKVEVSFHQQTQQIDYFLNCLYLIETICCSGSCVYVQVEFIGDGSTATTILLRLKSPANNGKRNVQHGRNRS